MKETVYAVRDVKKGEALTSVAQRQDGFFYFVDASGTVMRAKMEPRKPLDPRVKAQREAEKEAKRVFRERQRQERVRQKLAAEQARQQRRFDRLAAKEKKELVKQAKIRARIAELEAKL